MLTRRREATVGCPWVTRLKTRAASGKIARVARESGRPLGSNKERGSHEKVPGLARRARIRVRVLGRKRDGREHSEAQRVGEPGIHSQRRWPQPEGQRVFSRLFPASVHRAPWRHRRLPLRRGRRAAHGDARHARRQRGRDLQPPDAAAEAVGEPATGVGRGGFRSPEPVSTGAGRRGCVGREQVLRAERHARHVALPELPARAAGLQRYAVVLQQRLAEGEREVHGPSLELHLARHLPLHVPAPSRGHAGQDHGRVGEQDDHEPAGAVRARAEAARPCRGAARPAGGRPQAGQAAGPERHAAGAECRARRLGGAEHVRRDRRVRATRGPASRSVER